MNSYVPVPQPVATYGAEDQSWFWTQQWQAGEREASWDIINGNTTTFSSDEDFLSSL